MSIENPLEKTFSPEMNLDNAINCLGSAMNRFGAEELSGILDDNEVLKGGFKQAL